MASIWPDRLADVSWMQALKIQTVSWLRADPILTGLVAGRVYTVVPPHTAFPLITIEAATARPTNRFRNPGRTVTLQVRAQSQDQDEGELDAIADRIAWLLEGPVVSPCGPCRAATWTVDPTASPPAYTDDLAGRGDAAPADDPAHSPHAMTTPDVYGLAVELLALAATLVQALQVRSLGAVTIAPAACPHPPAAREPAGTLASPWKRYRCRDCQQVISLAKER